MGTMVKGLTGKDEKVIRLLVEMNVPRNLAQTIVFFSKNNNCLCSDIQKVTDLRQPEVSMVMQNLRERGWVEVEPVHREEKGRPMISYRLKVPFDRIITTIIQEEQKKIKNLRRRIQSLKDLTK